MPASKVPPAASRRRKVSAAPANASTTTVVASPASSRPAIPFDGTDKDKVRLLAMAGTPHLVIATLIGCGEAELQAQFGEELDFGLAHANALVGATLFSKCLNGEAASIVWWEKTRMGRGDPTGAGVRAGKIIEHRDMSQYSDAELDIIERAAAILARGRADAD